MPSHFNLGTSVLASSLRLWNGTWGVLPAKVPQQLLHLYDREDDAQCRLVREVLTELNLDAMIYPCPLGGERFLRKRLQLRSRLSGGNQPELPLLYDPNTDKVALGADDVIAYLFSHYLGQTAPARLQPGRINRFSANLASFARSPFAIRVEPSIAPKKPLTLYSFESSPYARLVRERLCALELPYHLINVGKQNWGEMGPAKRRLAPGPYEPLPGSKRDHFLRSYGKVQIPFLLDPNKKTELFESAAIIHYLDSEYAKPQAKSGKRA